MTKLLSKTSLKKLLNSFYTVWGPNCAFGHRFKVPWPENRPTFKRHFLAANLSGFFILLAIYWVTLQRSKRSQTSPGRYESVYVTFQLSIHLDLKVTLTT